MDESQGDIERAAPRSGVHRLQQRPGARHKWKQADSNRRYADWKRERFKEDNAKRLQARRSARSLPRVMMITDVARMQAPSELEFNLSLISALKDGARLILVREKNLGGRRPDWPNAHQRHAAIIGHNSGARVLFHSSIAQAQFYAAGGVHFRAHPLVAHSIRRAVSQGLLCGASTHSLQEALRAQQAGAHYILLGSIFLTASHPKGVPIGLQVLVEAARTIKIPIFAIGGINSQNARACLEAGAHGIAVIRAAWDAEERRKLLRIVEEF